MPQETDELKKMITDLGQEVLGIRLTVDKMHRKMRWSSVYGFLKFLIIIAPLLWAYVFFQPQIREFYGLYGNMIEQLKNLQTMQKIQPGSGTNSADLLRQFQEQYPQLKQ